MAESARTCEGDRATDRKTERQKEGEKRAKKSKVMSIVGSRKQIDRETV